MNTYEPHGCVIVYSITQRSSFQQAEEIVRYLWRENVCKEKAVILVGNKVDLARSRAISSAEGISLAKSIDAKFIETSSGIQHNVDELLVGVLKQVNSRVWPQIHHFAMFLFPFRGGFGDVTSFFYLLVVLFGVALIHVKGITMEFIFEIFMPWYGRR